MNSRPLFTKYLKELSAVSMHGDAREESFYPVLKTMAASVLLKSAIACSRRRA